MFFLLFFHRTYHLLTYYLNFFFLMCVVIILSPPLSLSLSPPLHSLTCSTMYPKHLDQCIAHSRRSIVLKGLECYSSLYTDSGTKAQSVQFQCEDVRRAFKDKLTSEFSL